MEVLTLVTFQKVELSATTHKRGFLSERLSSSLYFRFFKTRNGGVMNQEPELSGED